jgi:hypothetical protein
LFFWGGGQGTEFRVSATPNLQRQCGKLRGERPALALNKQVCCTVLGPGKATVML